MTDSLETNTVALPLGACYWAVLPATCRRLSLQARGYRSERVLPVPVEQLQLSSTQLGDGRVVVMGIEHDRLQEALAAHGQPAWSAVPAAAPGHLQEVLSTDRLQELNVLHGRYEPVKRRQLRQLMLLVLAVGLVIAGVIAADGVRQRVQHYRAEAKAFQQQAATIYEAALPEGATTHLVPQLAIEQELRRLQAAAGGAGFGLRDGTQSLQALWQVWPRQLRLQIDTVTYDGQRLMIRGRAPTIADAGSLADALRGYRMPEERWQLQTPDIKQSADHASFTCILARQQEDN